MINDNIDILIEDTEIEENLMAAAAAYAGAPIVVGYGLITAPLVYVAYKAYKSYRDRYKAAKTEEEKQKLEAELSDAKLKFEKAKEQEIAKRKAKKQEA